MSEDIDALDALEAQAVAIDAESSSVAPPGAQDSAPEAVRVDVAAEVAALLHTVAGILTPAFPCLATIYTEPTCRRLGEAAAPVMDKYGFSVGGIFDRWGAEITLAAVALPVVVATVQGIKSDMSARREPTEPQPTESNQADYANERAA